LHSIEKSTPPIHNKCRSFGSNLNKNPQHLLWDWREYHETLAMVENDLHVYDSIHVNGCVG
jgi:hypothetical protein